MRTILTGALLFSSAIASAVGLAAPPVQAPTPTVPFTMQRSKILFDALVEGRHAAALLDSGADFSVLDTAFAASAGLKGGKTVAIAASSGNISAQVVPVVRLEIAGQLTATMPMLSADLSAASKLIAHPIDIIVGGEIMRRRALLLSFSRNRFGIGPSVPHRRAIFRSR